MKSKVEKEVNFCAIVGCFGRQLCHISFSFCVSQYNVIAMKNAWEHKIMYVYVYGISIYRRRYAINDFLIVLHQTSNRYSKWNLESKEQRTHFINME